MAIDEFSVISVALKFFQNYRQNVSSVFAAVLTLYLIAGCSGGNTSVSQPTIVAKGTPSSSENSSYSIRISPDQAMVKTTLSAVIEPAVPGNKATFTWFLNGKPVQTDEGDYFVGGSARKENVIAVQADITDFHGNRFHVESNSVTIQNSPPTLIDTPTISSTNEGLAVAAQATDDDDDPVTLEYQWLENDHPMDGATSEQLETKWLKAGNQYAVRVTPYDGTARGTGLLATAVRTQEQALKVSLKPVPATSGHEITAEISPLKAQDADIFFEWLVNGMVVEGASGPTLNHTQFKKGDTIAARVYNKPPTDSTRGLLGTSNTILIVNSPPIIEPVHASKLQEGGRYEISVVAKDPDGDPVTFTLEEGPEGMTLDPKSGRLQWVPPNGMGQPVHIVIVASDSEGLGSRLSFDFLVGMASGENKVHQ